MSKSDRFLIWYNKHGKIVDILWIVVSWLTFWFVDFKSSLISAAIWYLVFALLPFSGMSCFFEFAAHHYGLLDED